MTKHEIAQALKEIAFFLSLKGDNPYKAQAYERAGAASSRRRSVSANWSRLDH